MLSGLSHKMITSAIMSSISRSLAADEAETNSMVGFDLTVSEELSTRTDTSTQILGACEDTSLSDSAGTVAVSDRATDQSQTGSLDVADVVSSEHVSTCSSTSTQAVGAYDDGLSSTDVGLLATSGSNTGAITTPDGQDVLATSQDIIAKQSKETGLGYQSAAVHAEGPLAISSSPQTREPPSSKAATPVAQLATPPKESNPKTQKELTSPTKTPERSADHATQLETPLSESNSTPKNGVSTTPSKTPAQIKAEYAAMQEKIKALKVEIRVRELLRDAKKAAKEQANPPRVMLAKNANDPLICSLPKQASTSTGSTEGLPSHSVVYQSTGVQILPVPDYPTYVRCFGEHVTGTRPAVRFFRGDKLKYELCYGKPFVQTLSAEVAESKATEDHGFQSMDFAYREVFLRNAKNKALENAKLLEKWASEKGMRLVSEKVDEYVAHSQQIPPNFQIKFDSGGQLDLAAIGTSELPNIVYLDVETCTGVSPTPVNKSSAKELQKVEAISKVQITPVTENDLDTLEDDVADATNKRSVGDLGSSNNPTETSESSSRAQLTLASAEDKISSVCSPADTPAKSFNTPEKVTQSAAQASKKRKADDDDLESLQQEDKKLKSSHDTHLAKKAIGVTRKTVTAKASSSPLISTTNSPGQDTSTTGASGDASVESSSRKTLVLEKCAAAVIETQTVQMSSPAVTATGTTKKRKMDDNQDEIQPESKRLKSTERICAIKPVNGFKRTHSTGLVTELPGMMKEKSHDTAPTGNAKSTKAAEQKNTSTEKETPKTEAMEQKSAVTEAGSKKLYHPKAVPQSFKSEGKTLTVTGHLLQQPRFPKKPANVQAPGSSQIPKLQKPVVDMVEKQSLKRSSSEMSAPASEPASEASKKRKLAPMDAELKNKNETQMKSTFAPSKKQKLEDSVVTPKTTNEKQSADKGMQGQHPQKREQKMPRTTQKSAPRPPRPFALAHFRDVGLVNKAHPADDNDRGGEKQHRLRKPRWH